MNSFAERLRQLIETSRKNITFVRTFRGHVMDSELFKQMFGFSYKDYADMYGPYDIISVRKSIADAGQIYDVLVDQDGWIIDGYTRAQEATIVQGGFHARVLPIKCTESEDNMLLCTAIIFYQLVGVKHKDYRKVVEFYRRIRPVFEEHGIDLSSLIEIIPPEVRPRLEELIVLREAKGESETIERLIERYASDLGLPSLAEPAKTLFRQHPVRTYERSRSAVALAYLYCAAKLMGCPRRTLNKILNYSPEPHVTRRRVWNVLREIRIPMSAVDVWKIYADRVRRVFGDGVAEMFYRIGRAIEERGLLAGKSRAVTAAQILYIMMKHNIISVSTLAINDMFGVTDAGYRARRQLQRGDEIIKAIEEMVAKMTVKQVTQMT